MDKKNLIQKNILDSLESNPHGLLILSMRLGKTKLVIDLIKRDKPKKVLWVTPNTKLRDEDIPNEFVKWNATKELNKTDIICYSSLSKQVGNYDLVVLDEVQYVTLSNVKNFYDKTLKYNNIIGMTGTLTKDVDKLNILRSLNLKILKNISLDTAVNLGVVAPYSIIKIGVTLDSVNKNVKSGTKLKPFYQTEFDKYNYLTRVIEEYKIKNPLRKVPMHLYLNRMRFIYKAQSKQEFAKKLLNKLEGKTLVFTGSIENAEKISEYTYHSKRNDKCLKQFLNGEINHLVCVNSGGVGYTFKDIDNVIIVQSDSNKNGNTLQKLARALVPRDNYKANIFMLFYKDTIDEDWVNYSLSNLDNKNIKVFNNENYFSN